MASSRSEENVNLKHFKHLKVSQCWSVLQFYFGHFYLGCLADVIANVCFSHILLFGRCYCHLLFFVVDVKPLVLCMSDWIDMWADVIAIHFCD